MARPLAPSVRPRDEPFAARMAVSLANHKMVAQWNVLLFPARAPETARDPPSLEATAGQGARALPKPTVWIRLRGLPSPPRKGEVLACMSIAADKVAEMLALLALDRRFLAHQLMRTPKHCGTRLSTGGCARLRKAKSFRRTRHLGRGADFDSNCLIIVASHALWFINADLI